MEITGIHHVQITIPANMEEQAKLFYCELLGLPEITKPAALQNRGGFWLQVGARMVTSSWASISQGQRRRWFFRMDIK